MSRAGMRNPGTNWPVRPCTSHPPSRTKGLPRYISCRPPGPQSTYSWTRTRRSDCCSKRRNGLARLRWRGTGVGDGATPVEHLVGRVMPNRLRIRCHSLLEVLGGKSGITLGFRGCRGCLFRHSDPCPLRWRLNLVQRAESSRLLRCRWLRAFSAGGTSTRGVDFDLT
jgi:hypothetical protein